MFSWKTALKLVKIWMDGKLFTAAGILMIVSML